MGAGGPPEFGAPDGVDTGKWLSTEEIDAILMAGARGAGAGGLTPTQGAYLVDWAATTRARESMLRLVLAGLADLRVVDGEVQIRRREDEEGVARMREVLRRDEGRSRGRRRRR